MPSVFISQCRLSSVSGARLYRIPLNFDNHSNVVNQGYQFAIRVLHHHIEVNRCIFLLLRCQAHCQPPVPLFWQGRLYFHVQHNRRASLVPSHSISSRHSRTQHDNMQQRSERVIWRLAYLASTVHSFRLSSSFTRLHEVSRPHNLSPNAPRRLL